MADSVAKKIILLREEIRQHDYAYYVHAKPKLSDQQYDQLLKKLGDLEDQHPELITPDSPTQRVGGEPIEGFEHVTHVMPMLSIDNTYDADQLREFDRRVAGGLDGKKYRYLVDPKIDGVAVSLRYEDGSLVIAATRGDGKTGDIITHNAKKIKSIPLKLNGQDYPEIIEVRGEIYWPTKDFNEYNRRREKADEPTFANPRNATAGSLKQLDPNKLKGRNLQFLAHGFGQIEPLVIDSTSKLFDQFQKWGVPVSVHRKMYTSIDVLIDELQRWQDKRRKYGYETDGLVIKVDAFDQRDVLGATSRHPRWCIAYKFEAERAKTKLLDVDFQVGKLGTITPRAVMEPVQLSGTTVQHATLHNFDQVERLDIRVGDTVVVEKAGEIIPQVIDVIHEDRPKNTRAIKKPTSCPVCKGDVEQDEGGVYIRCINPSCPAQLKERLIHFAGRNQMDIEGAGQVLIETLVDAGFIQDYADLYHLHEQRSQLIKLKRMGEKSVEKLLDGIESSKKQPLSKLLTALNIRHVGTNTAELLADHFGSMEKVRLANEEELAEIDGVGPEMANSIVHFFKSKKGATVVDRLHQSGVNMTQPKRKRVTLSVLSGKTVVFTGTMENLGRKEAQDLVKELGGKSSGSVSKKTDLLVYGESAGSKLKLARKLGVKTVTEKEFLRMIGKSSQ